MPVFLDASKLTTLAKSLLRMCKWEMEEIETCPDCYGNAYVNDNWFTMACVSSNFRPSPVTCWLSRLSAQWSSGIGS